MNNKEPQGVAVYKPLLGNMGGLESAPPCCRNAGSPYFSKNSRMNWTVA